MFTNSLSVAPYFKIKSRSYIVNPEKQRRQNPESTSWSFECSCCLVVHHGLNSPNHFVKKKCQKCDNHRKKELFSSFHFNYTLCGRIQGVVDWVASHPPPTSLGSFKLKIRKRNKTITEATFSLIVALSFRQVSPPSHPPFKILDPPLRWDFLHGLKSNRLIM